MKRKMPAYAVIIVIGILLIITGIKDIADIVTYTNEWNDFKDTAVSANATVTSKWEHYSRRHKSVNIHLKYEDEDGNEYESTLKRDCEGFTEDADVVIYYDKNHPKKIMVHPDIMLKSEKAWLMLPFSLGVILISVGVIVKKYAYE